MGMFRRRISSTQEADVPHNLLSDAKSSLAEDELRIQKRKLEFVMEDIGRTVTRGSWRVSACPVREGSLHEYVGSDVGRRSLGRISGNRMLDVARFTDGFLVKWVTPEFLLDYFHRVVVPAEGDVQYYRKPINVDCQMIPGSAISLLGVEQMVTIAPVVFPHLRFAQGAIEVEARHGWNANAQIP